MDENLQRLLAMAGLDTVPPPLQTAIIQSVVKIKNDTSELQQLLSLSGITLDDLQILDHTPDCECGECGSIVDDVEVEEQADYDIGKNPALPQGEEEDIDAYGFLGKDNLPTRNVPARSADNPLTGRRGVSSVEEQKSFRSYLEGLSSGE